MNGIAGIIFVVCCVHGGGMLASMIPHGGNPGNSLGVASLWELHSLAKAFTWLGKQDPAAASKLDAIAKQLDAMQTSDAAKIDALTAQNAALVAALKAANIAVPGAK